MMKQLRRPGILTTIVMMSMLLTVAVSVKAEPMPRPLRGPDAVAELMHKLETLTHAQAMLLEAGEREAAERMEQRLNQLHREIEEQRRLHREGHEAQPPHELQMLCQRLIEQNAQLRGDIEALRNELREVHELVEKLTNTVTQQQLSEHAAKMERVNLSGQWTLTLPSGHTSQVELIVQEDQLVRFKSKTVLAGTYEHHGATLSMVLPVDKRLTEFVWTVRDDDLLLLIESSRKTGSDYTGATLTRVHHEHEVLSEIEETAESVEKSEKIVPSI